jgi:hypothetical protein
MARIEWDHHKKQKVTTTRHVWRVTRASENKWERQGRETRNCVEERLSVIPRVDRTHREPNEHTAHA